MGSIADIKKLGIVAGKGELPTTIARECYKKGMEVFVASLDTAENTEKRFRNVPHGNFRLGAVGSILKTFKKHQISDIVLVGKVHRPKFSALRPDLGGVKLLTRLAKLRATGDSATFDTIIRFLEDSGFHIWGVRDVVPEILAPLGVIGNIRPEQDCQKDLEIGMEILAAIGAADIGQAVIVQKGLVLGVEAVEGTNNLIRRCASFQEDGKGAVLVKAKKIAQDDRIDLPTIGTATIELLHEAGMRAVGVQAESTLIVNMQKVIDIADTLGVAIVGLE